MTLDDDTFSETTVYQPHTVPDYATLLTISMFEAPSTSLQIHLNGRNRTTIQEKKLYIPRLAMRLSRFATMFKGVALMN